MYKVLYSAAGTGQISLGFRLSCGRQKWAMGPFLETEEKVQVTVPCTSGGHIQKFTKSSIAPHVNTFIKSYIVQLCIVFLNQDLSFHFVFQLDCEFLKCTDSVTLFCFLRIKSASSHSTENTVFVARQPVLKGSSTISYVTLGKLDSVGLNLLSVNGVILILLSFHKEQMR